MAKSMELLPRDVGHYRRLMTDPMPKVMSKLSDKLIIEEKKLKRFFKCTKFNLKCGNELFQCFATKNFAKSFVQHLNNKHSFDLFYCVYCYPNINVDENKVSIVK